MIDIINVIDYVIMCYYLLCKIRFIYSVIGFYYNVCDDVA